MLLLTQVGLLSVKIASEKITYIGIPMQPKKNTEYVDSATRDVNNKAKHV